MKKLTSFLCAGIVTISTFLHAGAQDKMPRPLPQPGYYRMTLGDFEITALSDGTIPLQVDKLLLNTHPGQIDAALSSYFQTQPVETSVNAYLIRTGNHLYMVDAGTAELLGPTLGHLSASIRAAGYTPEQVEAILITHIHTDHTGGLMEGDRMVFPNATLYISRKEAGFWLSKEAMEQAPASRKKYFTEALTKVGPYVKAGKVKLFDYNGELFPGITPVATPGHTPGHTFYAIASKGQKIMFWGDIIHVGPVQFTDPGVTIEFDIDPQAAAAARIKAFREAVRDGYWIAADHLSFPGIGHLREENGKFRWVPINYSNSGNGQ
ncbi:MBL fold metallo-hydrolase [Chitinophaga sp. Mgbs1]|uniref:MBL fold metallo-hydrolase n=1 Tax=Chitinophaga solisilvae TaxID=1233460 RepID=A0A9Q5CVT5_9BACT|nr:MBL fold metallo-hydrolase [Chitinophaga solisilvae]